MKAPHFQRGHVIAGKYRVEQTLGVGGFGCVIAAYHLRLGQMVALKFMLRERLRSLEFRERFQREARIVARMRSLHVTRVLDIGELETGAPYIVMEYLEGQDLKRFLERQRPVPLDETLSYIMQAAEGIAEAHSLGVVHRDLKPANLFITQHNDGTPLVKVLDFGLSKTGGQTLTGRDHVIGSPTYASPEQILTPHQVDARADIWSLGVLLYEMLSGNLPFPSKKLGELSIQILYTQAPSLAEAAPFLPQRLVAAVDRCLAKRIEDRYANIAEFAAAIAKCGNADVRASADRIAKIIGPRLPMHMPEVTVADSSTLHGLGDD
jgi:serine/threonine protein kinase